MKITLQKTSLLFSFFASANVFTFLNKNVLNINFNTYLSKYKPFGGIKLYFI